MALRNISVLNVVGFICFLLAAFWLKWAMTNSRMLNDETSKANLSSASQNATPLIEALEKYRADNGFYPITLNALNAGYHSTRSMHSLLYSANLGDWIFKSQACTARQKSLQGWIMETTDKYQSQVAQFQSGASPATATTRFNREISRRVPTLTGSNAGHTTPR
jgi:hypothetical protein